MTKLNRTEHFMFSLYYSSVFFSCMGVLDTHQYMVEPLRAVNLMLKSVIQTKVCDSSH